jgi:hypothetical protein
MWRALGRHTEQLVMYCCLELTDSDRMNLLSNIARREVVVDILELFKLRSTSSRMQQTLVAMLALLFPLRI